MAANVKITANSSDFQKQMREMATELKKVGSQFSLANTEAKLFGKENDVLKTKQSELTEKLKIQNDIVKKQADYIKKLNDDLSVEKTRHEQLKNALAKTTEEYKQAIEKTGKTSKESKDLSDKIKELKDELSKNEKAIENNNKKLDDAEIKFNKNREAVLKDKKALEDFNKQLDVQKLDDYSQKLDKVSTAFGKVSDKMKPISAALGAAGAVAGKTSMDLEENIAKMATIAGDFPIDKLTQQIVDLSNKTGVAAPQIAEDFYNIMSSGQSPQNTAAFEEASLKLSKAGFADSSQTTDLLSTINNAYGSAAGSLDEISDKLIKTQNIGKITVGEMATDMGKIIPVANNVNVGLDQLAAGYAVLTSNGIKSSEATTYMNTMLGEFADTNSRVNKALVAATGKTFPEFTKSGKTLGDAFKVLQTYSDKNNIALDSLFTNMTSKQAVWVLAKDNAGNFGKALEDIQKSTGSTDEAFGKVSDTMKNNLKVSLNELKNSLIGFGNALSPFINTIATVIGKVATVFNGLSDGQKKVVVNAGLAFIGINTLLGGFRKLSTSVSNNIKFIKDVGEKLKDLGGNAKNGKTFLSNLGTTIKDTAGKAGSLAKSIGGMTIELGKNAVQWTLNNAKILAYKGAQLAAKGATGLLTGAQKLLNAVMSANPIGIVITLVLGLVTAFVTLYNKCEWFRDGVNKIFGKIKDIFKGFVDFFKNMFTKDWTETFGILGVPLNAFFSSIKTIIDGIKGVFSGIVKFFKGVFSGDWKMAFQGLVDIIKSVFSAVAGLVKAPFNAAISAINWVIEKINKINFTVPDWVPLIGGQNFGFHLPTIPKLAEGGIVTKATLAVVGEGKEHEAVIPLSKLDALVSKTIERTISNVKGDNKNPQGTGNYYEVIVPVDGKIVARTIIDSMGNILNKTSDNRSIMRGGAHNARFVF